MGGRNSSLTNSNRDLKSPIYVEKATIVENSAERSSREIQDSQENQNSQEKQDSEEKRAQFSLNQLSLPSYLFHVKQGNTLCSNNHVLVLQDGPTTMEFLAPPKFKPKSISWYYGLVRDIAWCPNLNTFILLTKDALLSVSTESLFSAERIANKPFVDLEVKKYDTVKPCDDNISFWRCTCAGTKLFINYSGYGTVIDGYLLKKSSCELVERWKPPQTCATYEGIWCIRYHQDSKQLGFSIMDTRNNQWRIEIRGLPGLVPLWRLMLPIANGDCEICPLLDGGWLVINSCGIRLIQIVNENLKAGVEYERELRNAFIMGKSYFAIRTKTTIEIHQIK